MPTTVDVLILLAAVAGSGSMVGVGVWLYHRVKRLEAENRDLVQLTEQVDVLRDHLGAVQDQVGELYERLDFAERMLTRGREKHDKLQG